MSYFTDMDLGKGEMQQKVVYAMCLQGQPMLVCQKNARNNSKGPCACYVSDKYVPLQPGGVCGSLPVCEHGAPATVDGCRCGTSNIFDGVCIGNNAYDVACTPEAPAADADCYCGTGPNAVAVPVGSACHAEGSKYHSLLECAADSVNASAIACYFERAGPIGVVPAGQALVGGRVVASKCVAGAIATEDCYCKNEVTEARTDADAGPALALAQRGQLCKADGSVVPACAERTVVAEPEVCVCGASTTPVSSGACIAGEHIATACDPDAPISATCYCATATGIVAAPRGSVCMTVGVFGQCVADVANAGTQQCACVGTGAATLVDPGKLCKAGQQHVACPADIQHAGECVCAGEVIDATKACVGGHALGKCETDKIVPASCHCGTAPLRETLAQQACVGGAPLAPCLPNRVNERADGGACACVDAEGVALPARYGQACVAKVVLDACVPNAANAGPADCFCGSTWSVEAVAPGRLCVVTGEQAMSAQTQCADAVLNQTSAVCYCKDGASFVETRPGQPCGKLPGCGNGMAAETGCMCGAEIVSADACVDGRVLTRGCKMNEINVLDDACYCKIDDAVTAVAKGGVCGTLPLCGTAFPTPAGCMCGETQATEHACVGTEYMQDRCAEREYSAVDSCYCAAGTTPEKIGYGGICGTLPNCADGEQVPAKGCRCQNGDRQSGACIGGVHYASKCAPNEINNGEDDCYCVAADGKLSVVAPEAVCGTLPACADRELDAAGCMCAGKQQTTGACIGDKHYAAKCNDNETARAECYCTVGGLKVVAALGDCGAASHACKSELENCTSCIFEKTCTACKSGYDPVDNCKEPISDCAVQCSWCASTGSAVCHKCKSGYGFYATNACRVCADANCAECADNYAECTACATGFKVHGGSCRKTGLTGGAIAGIVIAVIVVVAVVGCVAFFLLKRRGGKSEAYEQHGEETADSGDNKVAVNFGVE